MIGFAAVSEQIIIHAEPVFTIFGVHITNSMLLGWLTSLFLVVMLVAAAQHVKIKVGTKKLSLIEIACEQLVNSMDDVMGDRGKAIKFAPFLLTLTFFILFNNWVALIPGVGSITYHGVPLFRPWT